MVAIRVRSLLAVLVAVALISTVVVPAAAIPVERSDDCKSKNPTDRGACENTTDPPDECMNAKKGPAEGGPPGFVADLVPNFISNLFADLPVPDFVKKFFGAPTC